MSRGVPAIALPGLVTDLRQNLAMGTPLAGYETDPFSETPSGDIYGDPYTSGGGGGSAALRAERDDFEIKFIYNNHQRWALMSRIEQATGKKIDHAKSWPRGHNNGTGYEGIIVFTDGTIF